MLTTVENKPPVLESFTVSFFAFVFQATAIIWALTIAEIDWLNLYPVWLALTAVFFIVVFSAVQGRKKLGKLTYNSSEDTVQINKSRWVKTSELTDYDSSLNELPLARFLSRMIVKLSIDGNTVTLTDNKALAFGNKGFSEEDMIVLRKIGQENNFPQEKKERYLLWLARVEDVNSAENS